MQQAADLDNASLVVGVLCEAAESESSHLLELHVCVAEHVNQRWHSAPLHDPRLVVWIGGGKLPEQESCFPLRLCAVAGQQPDDWLQRPLFQHLPLDVLQSPQALHMSMQPSDMLDTGHVTRRLCACTWVQLEAGDCTLCRHVISP